MPTSTMEAPTGSTQKTFSPESVIQDWGIKRGDHVADFGAGHGYFTLPIARIVGAEGKVYALDIQKSVLEVIRSRAKLVHLLNIECIWADLEHMGGSKLKDSFIDLVIIANIVFQADEKNVIFKEAFRVLRPGGKVAIIESSEDAKVGPPRELRIPRRTVIELAQLNGFHFDREFNAGSDHYGLIFAK